MQKALEVRDLHVEYKVLGASAKVLNGVSFSINQGEAFGLVGETGAGKTTTALSILRLLPKRSGRITSGEIYLEGQNILSLSEKELMRLRSAKMAMIFQNPLSSLNPVFTVGEQIGMVLNVQGQLSQSQITQRVGELLELVGISAARMHDYPNQFSGGMRQRVGIASALAGNPAFIIADEPTTALDVTIQAQILELIRELQSKMNTSLLMITHNLGIVSELCQSVAVMYAGRIIERGAVSVVFRNPAHPYTKGLFASIPKLYGEREELMVIEGNVANPYQLPQGCPFHPRCVLAKNICREQSPTECLLEEEHFVSCHHHSCT